MRFLIKDKGDDEILYRKVIVTLRRHSSRDGPSRKEYVESWKNRKCRVRGKVSPEDPTVNREVTIPIDKFDHLVILSLIKLKKKYKEVEVNFNDKIITIYAANGD